MTRFLLKTSKSVFSVCACLESELASEFHFCERPNAHAIRSGTMHLRGMNMGGVENALKGDMIVKCTQTPR